MDIKTEITKHYAEECVKFLDRVLKDTPSDEIPEDIHWIYDKIWMVSKGAYKSLKMIVDKTNEQ